MMINLKKDKKHFKNRIKKDKKAEKWKKIFWIIPNQKKNFMIKQGVNHYLKKKKSNQQNEKKKCFKKKK